MAVSAQWSYLRGSDGQPAGQQADIVRARCTSQEHGLDRRAGLVRGEATGLVHGAGECGETVGYISVAGFDEPVGVEQESGAGGSRRCPVVKTPSPGAPSMVPVAASR